MKLFIILTTIMILGIVFYFVRNNYISKNIESIREDYSKLIDFENLFLSLSQDKEKPKKEIYEELNNLYKNLSNYNLVLYYNNIMYKMKLILLIKREIKILNNYI